MNSEFALKVNLSNTIKVHTTQVRRKEKMLAFAHIFYFVTYHLGIFIFLVRDHIL